MRPERTAMRARVRERAARAAEAEARRRTFDQRLVAAVAAALILSLVYVVLFAALPPRLAWTPAVVALFLVVAAGAGRALLGHRPGDQTDGTGPHPRRWLMHASIVAAAVLPYLLSLRVGFLSDDFALTESAGKAHSIIEAFTFLPFVTLYRPLHVVVWWAGLHLWGGAPLGYHVVSLAFHAANSLLVLALGRRMIGSAGGAWAAALLFAVHPIHVEAITWASCQLDLQATTFALLSLLSLEGYLAAPRRGRRALALAGSAAAFLLAVLTKESALSLPGVAVLRVFLHGGERRIRRSGPAAGVYAASLAGYLAMRFAALHGIGGYLSRSTFWNTVFPSAPLRQIASFFFPLHHPLALSAGGPWLEMAAVGLMAAGLLWWIVGLPRVSGQRLWLYLGFVFLLTVPVWLLPGTARDLEYSRYAYLPTIGLVLLFGELAAARQRGAGPAGQRSRGSGPVAATIVVCAALSVWYLSPWLGAARIRQRVLAAGRKTVEALPDSGTRPVVYVENLPDTDLGAQVFRNGFPSALGGLLKRPALLRPVGMGPSAVPTSVLALSTLFPGEYVVAWEGKARGFRLMRAGGTEQAAGRGAAP